MVRIESKGSALYQVPEMAYSFKSAEQFPVVGWPKFLVFQQL